MHGKRFAQPSRSRCYKSCFWFCCRFTLYMPCNRHWNRNQRIRIRTRTRLAVSRPPRELMSCRDSQWTDVRAGLDSTNYLFCLCSSFTAEIFAVHSHFRPHCRMAMPPALAPTTLSRLLGAKRAISKSAEKSVVPRIASPTEPRLAHTCLTVLAYSSSTTFDNRD